MAAKVALKVDTPAGTCTLRQAIAADVPGLIAVAMAHVRAHPLGDAAADLVGRVAGDVRDEAVQTVSDGRGVVRGYLVGISLGECGVALRCVTVPGHEAVVGPVLSAAAGVMAGRGCPRIRVGTPTSDHATLSALLDSGFRVDPDCELDEQTALVTTGRRLAQAASPVPARTVSLSDASDDELAAEVRRRRTLVASVWTMSDVREELRREAGELDEEALEAAAATFMGLAGTELSDRLDDEASSSIQDMWDDRAEHILDGSVSPGPRP